MSDNVFKLSSDKIVRRCFRCTQGGKEKPSWVSRLSTSFTQSTFASLHLSYAYTSLRNTMNSFELYKLHQISRLDQAVETRLYYSNTQPPNLRASPTKHLILTHMSDMLYRFMLIAVTQETRRTQAPSGQASTPNKVDKKEMLWLLKNRFPFF